MICFKDDMQRFCCYSVYIYSMFVPPFSRLSYSRFSDMPNGTTRDVMAIVAACVICGRYSASTQEWPTACSSLVCSHTYSI